MSKKTGAKKPKMSSSSQMGPKMSSAGGVYRKTDPDDSDSSWEGVKARAARAEREQQRQACNISPLADEGEGHKRAEPSGDAGDDDGSGDDDRHTSPPSPPPTFPPPISPPPSLDPPSDLHEHLNPEHNEPDRIL